MRLPIDVFELASVVAALRTRAAEENVTMEEIGTEDERSYAKSCKQKLEGYAAGRNKRSTAKVVADAKEVLAALETIKVKRSEGQGRKAQEPTANGSIEEFRRKFKIGAA